MLRTFAAAMLATTLIAGTAFAAESSGAAALTPASAAMAAVASPHAEIKQTPDQPKKLTHLRHHRRHFVCAKLHGRHLACIKHGKIRTVHHFKTKTHVKTVKVHRDHSRRHGVPA